MSLAQVLLLLMWIVVVAVYTIINLLIRKQMVAIIGLRPSAKVVYRAQLISAIIFLGVALVFILTFNGDIGTTTTGGPLNEIVF